MNKHFKLNNAIKQFWRKRNNKNFIIIARANKKLQQILSTQAKGVRLSFDTLIEHEHRHKDINSFDYALIYRLIHRTYDFKKKNKDEKRVTFFSKYRGKYYRFAFKTTKDNKQIYLLSLIKSNEKIRR